MFIARTALRNSVVLEPRIHAAHTQYPLKLPQTLQKWFTEFGNRDDILLQMFVENAPILCVLRHNSPTAIGVQHFHTNTTIRGHKGRHNCRAGIRGNRAEGKQEIHSLLKCATEILRGAFISFHCRRRNVCVLVVLVVFCLMNPLQCSSSP